MAVPARVSAVPDQSYTLTVPSVDVTANLEPSPLMEIAKLYTCTLTATGDPYCTQAPDTRVKMNSPLSPTMARIVPAVIHAYRLPKWLPTALFQLVPS